MTTQTKIVTSRRPVKEAIKDASMVKQKEMMAAHYDRLTNVPPKPATRWRPPSCPAISMNCSCASTS